MPFDQADRLKVSKAGISKKPSTSKASAPAKKAAAPTKPRRYGDGLDQVGALLQQQLAGKQGVAQIANLLVGRMKETAFGVELEMIKLAGKNLMRPWSQ